MKLKKISIKALSNNELLSNKQMAELIGGYDTTSDSSCLFNCMEYIGKEVYKNTSANCDVYGNAYWKGHNDYVGTGDIGDYLSGPELYGSDGNINGNVANFIGAFFGSAASGFTTGSGASGLFKNGSNDGVMGIFNTGSGVAHAVILTGYDAETGTYSYYDPSKSSQGSNQTFAASDLYGAIDCKR